MKIDRKRIPDDYVQKLYLMKNITGIILISLAVPLLTVQALNFLLELTDDPRGTGVRVFGDNELSRLLIGTKTVYYYKESEDGVWKKCGESMETTAWMQWLGLQSVIASGIRPIGPAWLGGATEDLDNATIWQHLGLWSARVWAKFLLPLLLIVFGVSLTAPPKKMVLA